MEKLTVNLGDRSYPIHIGENILPQIGELMQEAGLRGKVAVVNNQTVAQLYLDTVHGGLTSSGFEMTPVLVPDGEEHKNLNSLAAIYNCLISERFDRK